MAVVLAEKEPDQVEVVEVRFDSPVTPDLRPKALAANAATTSREPKQELDRLLPDHPYETLVGTDQADGDHKRTVTTENRE